MKKVDAQAQPLGFLAMLCQHLLPHIMGGTLLEKMVVCWEPFFTDMESMKDFLVGPYCNCE